MHAVSLSSLQAIASSPFVVLSLCLGEFGLGTSHAACNAECRHGCLKQDVCDFMSLLHIGRSQSVLGVCSFRKQKEVAGSANLTAIAKSIGQVSCLCIWRP